MDPNPILVESTRGEITENFYRGSIAVVDAKGSLIESTGDIRRPIYPRSAIKPLQATVLIESGALDHYNLTDKEIALACASHSGEKVHVEGVENWLKILGLTPRALECGAHAPTDRDSRNRLIQSGEYPNPLHNNCSGKHAGFLTIVRYRGDRTQGYIDKSHQIQKEVLDKLKELTDEPLSSPPPAVDGCGIPAPAISLFGVATAFSRLATGKTDSAPRIINAMRDNPQLIGGTDRFCTVVPDLTSGKVLVKVGAEGVYAGMMLEEPKMAFALKIDDGSKTAAEIAAAAVIKRHGPLDEDELSALEHYCNQIVWNVAGREVGELRSVT